jgi:hypothetical protein
MPRSKPVSHSHFCITESGILQTILKNKHSLHSSCVHSWIIEFPSPVCEQLPLWYSPKSCTNWKVKWSTKRELCNSTTWVQVDGLENKSTYNTIGGEKISMLYTHGSLYTSQVWRVRLISKWRNTKVYISLTPNTWIQYYTFIS